MLGLLIAAVITCSPITRDEGGRLVLLTPRAAAMPPQHVAVRFMRLEYGLWLYRLYDPTARPGADLIGWYSVNPYGLTVTDWSADDLRVQTGPALRAAQQRLRDTHCSR